MRPCPNCGQLVSSDDDHFCPHCGYRLPWAQQSATQATPTPNTPPVQPQQPYAAAGQAQRQPAQGSGYTAGQPYADPSSAHAYQTPLYTNSGVSGANLPMPRVQQAPTPVAPVRGADPLMNTVADAGRSLNNMDIRGMLKLAAVLLVVIVAAVILLKVVAWFFAILPWVILLAAIVVGWQYRKRRRRLRRP